MNQTAVMRTQPSAVEVAITVAPPTDFDAFYRRSHPDVARALAATLGDPQLALEATDEAMARAYGRWNTVGHYDNPAGWTYRVGLNWARSWHRRASRRLPFGPVTTVEFTPADVELDRALRSLPVELRSVVVCRYLLDWSVEATASALDVKPGTVKSRLSRALDRLNHQLTPRSPEATR